MKATIKCDTRQQKGKHKHKDEWWARHGVSTTVQKLDVGDYTTENSRIIIDTKRNISEIAQNIGGRDHARFKRECLRAADGGYTLVVLVENVHGYRNIVNVSQWTNSHCVKCSLYRCHACAPKRIGKCKKHNTLKPIQGPRLAKAMKTMEERYGIRFEFCHPREAAKRICELLGVAYE